MKIEWKILKANADTERAQLNKVLADIADSISESASATLAQANITATMATEEGLNGFASAWRETFARVYEIEGTVTAIAQDVTALETRVDNVETGQSGNSQAIQTLTSRVDANEDGIIATAADVTTLEAVVYDPVTGLTATADAVESLEVQVNSINDTVMASYTLTLDANGYITGWKFTNDGTTGLVDFRADRFRITAPGSIKSVEFADGILMSNTGTHSYYMGVDFGVNSNLITWYGATPASGAAGATDANGLFWIKNDGSGYFGGGLSNTVVTNLPIIVNHESRLDTIEATYTDPVTGLAAAHARITEEADVRADADAANAAAITSVQASVGGKGSNLLWSEYSYFPADGEFPDVSSTGGITADTVVSSLGIGGRVLRIQTTTTNTAEEFRFGTSTSDYNLPLGPGDYIVSYTAFASVAGHAVRLDVVEDDGTQRAGPQVELTTAPVRYSHRITIDASTKKARLRLLPNRSGVSGRTVYMDSLMIEAITLPGTTPSAWTPGSASREVVSTATATQTLRADVDSVTGIVEAKWNVTLDVNGYVTGVESINSGTTSSFTIRSDKFVIVSPAGGARTEYSDGNWRVYDASGVLRVRMGVW